ncbi:MAG: threonine-phosphate decarboxylase CobD [Candidatus Methanoperedens sp.]|nr:threonine-phosphate decarboxylase CobD [Candidatus Methanoperedens sp.]MCZ7369482.1 threonine-phosphate decarboxylase CobD [Candidatus Methanoperedens sp.]
MPLKDKVRDAAIKLAPCIHGARVEESAEASGKRADELIDFSVNLNPLGPPKLKKILEKTWRNVAIYPDNRYQGFKKAAAEYLDVSPGNIVPGNGSSELIRLFAETVIEPGDEVIIPSPTFGEYEFQSRLFGARVGNIEYDDFTGIEPQGCKAVFLCNPNNPTGKLIKRDEVLKVAEKCIESEVFFFVDEAFIELSDPGETIADLAASSDFVICLRSLTKTYAVPGLRIGFAVASPEFAGIMNNIRLPWNLNSVGLEVGQHLLKDHEKYLSRSLELIRKERQWLASKLVSVRGFKPYASDANFILVDIRDFALDASELTQRMLRHGIIIRDCASFGLDNHIRVAVRRRAENQELIRALAKVISEWGSELAEKEIGRVLESGVTARSRVECEYYPCHFEGQDCTFCFCPLYPCENEKTGGEFVQKSTGGAVWSCAKCEIIHRGKIAEKVLKALMDGREINDVRKLVMDA